MEEIRNIKFNRIMFPKGELSVIEAGTWTTGTITTGERLPGGKYEVIKFKADEKVNTGN
ncbi:hypothetical protein MRBLBA21_005260 [Peribacillus frigoritolerans]|uniref:hypothetical protein n=1 Tax=Peribacillus frigoritolerans TaxID=450367 RepID=UPI001482EF61